MNQWKWSKSKNDQNNIQTPRKDSKQQFTRLYNFGSRIPLTDTSCDPTMYQTNRNPFLKENNYIQDISNENIFLRPKSSV